MEEDVENYMYFQMFGGLLRLKQSVVPHVFTCQGRAPKDSKNRASLQKKRLVLSAIQEQQHLYSHNLPTEQGTTGG